MNLSRLATPRKSWLSLLPVLLCGWFFVVPGGAASLDNLTSQADAAARGWLSEIDAGKYELSYDQGCTAFHNKVGKDEWITVLKAIRPALGHIVSRTETSHTYKPDGYEGLDGECMVIMYNAVYSKIGTVMEVVVLKREDGQWRGAGYNAQPQAPPAQDGTTQDDTTQGSTAQ